MNLMQKNLSRKIIISLTVLVVFGFFYFCREGIFNEYIGLANNAKQTGDKDAALENLIFASALDEKKSGGDISIKRAEVFYERGEYAAAEQELTQALASDSGNSALYELMGKTKNAQGDYAQAEKYFAKAYETDPTAELSVERAKNLARSGKFTEAEGVLEETRQKENSEDVIYYRGLIRLNNDKFSAEDFKNLGDGKYKSEASAVEDFFERTDNSVRFDSDYGLVSRADFFRKLGEKELALANLDIVLARNDKYRDAYLVLGKTLVAAGDYDQARASFEKCLMLDTGNAEALFYMSKIYEVTGSPEKAKEYEVRYKNPAE